MAPVTFRHIKKCWPSTVPDAGAASMYHAWTSSTNAACVRRWWRSENASTGSPCSSERMAGAALPHTAGGQPEGDAGGLNAQNVPEACLLLSASETFWALRPPASLLGRPAACMRPKESSLLTQVRLCWRAGHAGQLQSWLLTHCWRCSTQTVCRHGCACCPSWQSSGRLRRGCTETHEVC